MQEGRRKGEREGEREGLRDALEGGADLEEGTEMRYFGLSFCAVLS